MEEILLLNIYRVLYIHPVDMEFYPAMKIFRYGDSRW